MERYVYAASGSEHWAKDISRKAGYPPASRIELRLPSQLRQNPTVGDLPEGDDFGDVQFVTQAGSTTGFAYDELGQLATTTSPTGVKTAFGYDANGNQQSSTFTWTNPANPADVRTVTTGTTYDGDDRPTVTTDEFGHNSTSFFDAKGRVQQTTDVLNNTTLYVYNGADQVIKTTNPDGTISDTVYDGDGRVTYADDPHTPGQANVRGTHTLYDVDGRVTETDRVANLVITVTTQNNLSSSQLTSVGAVLSYTTSVYNDLGQVTSSRDAAGQTTLFAYDNAGHQTSVTDALNKTTSSAYDALGRQISTTDALLHKTQYIYNGDGQMVKTIFANGSTSQVAYDTNGRKSSETDPMGLTTNFGYDAQGHLASVMLPAVVDPENNSTVTVPTTKYAYDMYGNMTSITDAKGRVTSFTFDQFGHQLTRTLPLGQSESSTFDAFGRLDTHTDFKGQKEVYHYDSLGRNDTQTFFAAGSQTAGETMTYHFDTLGRNDTITDAIVCQASRLTTFGFDLDSNVTSITTPEGTINFVYDVATGRHLETWTGTSFAAAVSDTLYAYDALGRLSTVTVQKQNSQTPVGGAKVTTYYYTAVGNIDHVAYPNGTETDYTYDSLNRLATVTNKRGATVLSSYAYTVNLDGLRTGVTETQLEANGTTSTVAKVWTYDDDQRLTQEAVTVTGSPGYASYTDTYTMDLVGNRTAKSHTTGGTTLNIAYEYNANDQLTTESSTTSGQAYSTTYGYDANGSEISVSRTGSGAETDAYTYDLRNQLAGATISRTESGQSVAITASYLYNPDGIRTQSITTTTIGAGSPTTATTQFLNDPDNPTGYSQVLEERANGSLSMSYVEGLAILSQITGAEVTSYLMPDGQGSTRLVADASGTVTARVAYDAYGTVLGTTYGATNVPVTKMLYTGQQIDVGLQQEYNRARYYVTGIGRFSKQDSIEGGKFASPLSLQKYIYANVDPVNRVDPSGHDSSLISTIAMAGLTGGLISMLIGAPFRAYAASQQYVAGASLRDILLDTLQGAATDFAIGAVLGGGTAGLVRQLASNSFKIRAVGQSIFSFTSARVPWSPWLLGIFPRGLAIERSILSRAAGFLGQQIEKFPVIDDYIIRGGRGIATSIKSLDLTLPTFQSESALISRLSGYANKLQNFVGASKAGFTVGPGGHAITDKVLVLAFEQGAASWSQANALVQFVREAPTRFPDIRVVIQFVL
jgi:RHS repeat-associated protein